MCNSVLYLFFPLIWFFFVLFKIKVQPAREDIEGFHGTDAQASCIAKILSASQKYMRKQEVNQSVAYVVSPTIQIFPCLLIVKIMSNSR